MFSGAKYVRGILTWAAVYAVLLFASITLLDGPAVRALPLRVILGLSPMIAGFGILNLVMQTFRTADEMQQKITSESIMFAFGATAIITFSYGFLERSIGAPELSWFFVWVVMAAMWMLGTALASRRYR